MKSEDLNRYEQDRQGAAIDNSPLDIEDYKGALGLLNDENEALRKALKALVDEVGPFVWIKDGYICFACGAKSRSRANLQHKPDCAWEVARRLV